ncbi:MAG: amino acid permease, partial [Gammaproteobacteria bacterium]
EIAGLLLVIWTGSDVLTTVPAKIDSLLPPLQAAPMTGIVLGAFLAFFAFIGFEDMVNIAEEVKNPQHTLPAAILLALLIATLIYASVALVAVLSVDQSTLSSSTAPLADVISATSDIDPKIISLISMLAIVNGALIQMIMASRLFYGMAKKGWLWRPLSHVNASTQTPVAASVLVIVIILGLALWFPLETLAKSTSFLVLTVFALANASLLLIKRSQPQPAGILNNPAWVPLTGLVTCTGLLMFQVFTG